MWTPALIAIVMTLQGQGNPPDGVVARVGTSEIKASDVAGSLWEWRGAEVLNEIIDARVVADAAKKQGLSVTDKEVEDRVVQYLDEVKKQLPPDTDLGAYIAAQGYPRSRLVVRSRNELLINKMALKEFKPEEYVKVSTIVVPLKSQSATDLKGALDRTQAIYDRLQKGEAWEAVLNSVVDNPQVRQSKGLLGWRHIPAFPAPAQDELKALKVGGVTKPVQTQNGLQIFRIDAKSDGLTGEELESVRNLYLQNARGQILARLRSAAKIERVWKPRG